MLAQDKLFFANGTSRKGIIVTNAKDFIYFKITDTSRIEKISKSNLILMEDYKGNRYVFSQQDTQTNSIPHSQEKNKTLRNIFSAQPLAIFFGRANFAYERLSKDGRVGFLIPLIITFDPKFGNIFTADSNFNSVHVKGYGYITGLDLNFYSAKGETAKMFIGPRIRYGTDVAFYNTQGYSVQTQVGLKISRPDGKMSQSLSIGFGFVRIISSSSFGAINPKQSHAWYSLNYRFGIKW